MYLNYSFLVVPKGMFPTDFNNMAGYAFKLPDSARAFEDEQIAGYNCNEDEEVIPFAQAMNYIYLCTRHDS